MSADHSIVTPATPASAIPAKAGIHVRRMSALALVTTLGACSWFTDFRQQPKHDPWESPSDTIAMRGNPQFSVPVYGTFAPGFAVSRAAFPGTIDSMSTIANPVPADARSLRNGRLYYSINCAVCHGDLGKGDGPVTKKGMFVLPVVGASAEGKTDGYIWGMIRNGRGGMPSYNRIEEMDRWDVVNYVRGLQGKYQVATGPVGLPGETGDKVPGYSQTGPTRPSPYYKHAGSQADATRGFAFPRAEGATPAPVAAPAADSAAAGAAPARTTAPTTVPPTTTTPKTGGER
jgi:mono/diheme cytochrome c family protein